MSKLNSSNLNVNPTGSTVSQGPGGTGIDTSVIAPAVPVQEPAKVGSSFNSLIKGSNTVGIAVGVAAIVIIAAVLYFWKE